jgi:membrane protein DedA with SNARE-associated domain
VTVLAVTAPGGAGWQYILLFLAVAASWAGVPVVGATALGAAGVAASQGDLNLALVVLVSTAAGEVGGLIGYAIGNRWGRVLLDRPGKHQQGRERMVERGEQAYARWGRVAVFFTPAIVSGTAKMHHGEFVVWNLLASLGFSISVAASSYGLGRLFSGHYSAPDIATLVVGLLVGAAITTLYVRHRRHTRHRTGGATPTT